MLATVNNMTLGQIHTIANYMVNNNIQGRNVRYVYLGSRGMKCNLAPTVNNRGQPKYPQIDCNRWVPGSGKQLVHAIWWRHINNAMIPAGLELSHIDANPRYIETRAETHDYNESRKYCHLFGWFDTLPGEANLRCPHWEHHCTGP